MFLLAHTGWILYKDTHEYTLAALAAATDPAACKLIISSWESNCKLCIKCIFLFAFTAAIIFIELDEIKYCCLCRQIRNKA